MADAKASVFRETPSPIPPKSVIFALLVGIEGVATCGISKGRPSEARPEHAPDRIVRTKTRAVLIFFIGVRISVAVANIQ